MSERWSFCSEFIYCDKCADGLRKVVLEKMDFSQPNRGLFQGPTPNIVGGFGGGLATQDPKEEMYNVCLEAPSVICHPIRMVALYDDNTTEVFTLKPLITRHV